MRQFQQSICSLRAPSLCDACGGSWGKHTETWGPWESLLGGMRQDWTRVWLRVGGGKIQGEAPSDGPGHSTMWASFAKDYSHSESTRLPGAHVWDTKWSIVINLHFSISSASPQMQEVCTNSQSLVMGGAPVVGQNEGKVLRQRLVANWAREETAMPAHPYWGGCRVWETCKCHALLPLFSGQPSSQHPWLALRA